MLKETLAVMDTYIGNLSAQSSEFYKYATLGGSINLDVMTVQMKDVLSKFSTAMQSTKCIYNM